MKNQNQVTIKVYAGEFVGVIKTSNPSLWIKANRKSLKKLGHHYEVISSEGKNLTGLV